jgi:hypothetical protein
MGRYLPVVVIKAVVREVQTGQCPVMRVERTELTKRRASAMADLLSLNTRTQRLLRSGTCRGTADDLTGGEWVAKIHIGLRWPTRAMLTVMPECSGADRGAAPAPRGRAALSLLVSSCFVCVYIYIRMI